MMEVYKKTALYSREMYFTHFKVALVVLMKEINNSKMNALKKEFKEIKSAINDAQTDANVRNLKARLAKLSAEY